MLPRRVACSLFLSTLAACTTETIVRQAPAPSEPAPASPLDEGSAVEAPADEPEKDAGVDAAPAVPAAAWATGQSGKSCAESCKALGKTCAVACADHKSCGGHDLEPGPYAGYACYYRETKNASGSFRSNQGRSLLTCDAVATPTWTRYGDVYNLGSSVPTMEPVSCCCR